MCSTCRLVVAPPLCQLKLPDIPPHCAYAVGCRGLDAVKQSERVYLEAYTSLLLVPKETLVG